MRSAFAPLAAFLLVALGSSIARADVPPPNSSGCASKSAGDSCTTDDGKGGRCEKSTCSKLDYSDGTPPGTTTYDCLLCNTAGSASPSSTSTGSASTTPTTTQGGGSSCSFGARSLGAWGIAACVPLALLLRGRRRRNTAR